MFQLQTYWNRLHYRCRNSDEVREVLGQQPRLQLGAQGAEQQGRIRVHERGEVIKAGTYVSEEVRQSRQTSTQIGEAQTCRLQPQHQEIHYR